jgi:hypothetical protein
MRPTSKTKRHPLAQKVFDESIWTKTHHVLVRCSDARLDELQEWAQFISPDDRALELRGGDACFGFSDVASAMAFFSLCIFHHFAARIESEVEKTPPHGLDPLPPLCPLQPLKRLNDPQSDFEHGYIIGLERGMTEGRHR